VNDRKQSSNGCPMLTIPLLLAAFFFCMAIAGRSAIADEVEIWHGWMNLLPCTKVDWRNDGIFGTPSPTYVEAPQEFHGYIYADIPNGQDITAELQNDCIQCGVQAAAVTTVIAILTEGAGGWEAFSAAFWECLQNRADEATQHAVDSLRLATDTHCEW
jgi:hypothetical protein